MKEIKRMPIPQKFVTEDLLLVSELRIEMLLLSNLYSVFSDKLEKLTFSELKAYAKKITEIEKKIEFCISNINSI